MADTSPNTPKTDVVGKRLIVSIREFLRDRLSILDNANPENTIEGIEKDIDFKGFNLWILIVAIIMASVGLNANSTAVIIGAMLISPLMGPIMGIGLGIGILDLQMVKRGSRNLGIAVIVAMVTSSLFFLIIPISDVSSELLARTRPDIRDVFIAFFGGLAGILAGSRREKNNVIPGVAIATALMPPLCTAGYGLATLQFSYFLGAAYLFLINAFFIALATVITVRYLRFPKKTYVDATRERKGMRWLGFTVIIMIIPASIIFYNVVKETIARTKIEQFLATYVERHENAEIVKKEIITTDTANYVNLVMFGQPISAETISGWQKQLNKDAPNSILRIFQGKDREALPEVEQLVGMFTRSQAEIASREELIKKLENTVKAYEAAVLPTSLLTEIKINYPEVAHIKMGRMVYADFNSDTKTEIPTFFVEWKPGISNANKAARSKQLNEWLSSRLVNDSIMVLSMDVLN